MSSFTIYIIVYDVFPMSRLFTTGLACLPIRQAPALAACALKNILFARARISASSACSLLISASNSMKLKQGVPINLAAFTRAVLEYAKA